jgi:hypothetical protein
VSSPYTVAIRKFLPLPAAALALAGLLTIGGAGQVLADARPSIVSITLDANNHAVVTWTKEPWQGSVDVKWSSGDGTVAAPDANWDGHYGLPLVDCYGQPLDGNPYGGDSTKGQWNYGTHCKGQDVADPVTTATTWDELLPGVYYFQVEIAGENHQSGLACNYQDKGLPTECLSGHYSDVYRLTVVAEPNYSPPGSPAPSGEPGSSGAPGPATPQVLNGPGRFVPVGGGQVDVGAGGRVVSNPPYNFDVQFGRMHLREDLVSFHCPFSTEPFPPESTLADWIGVRCRTVTTPQAGALVKGTEFTVAVTAEATTFWVFEGQIEVSDLSHRGAVLLGPGQTTTVLTGQTPTAPTAFDTSDSSLRWWDSGPTDAEIAAIVFVSVGLFFILYFLPAMVALVRRPERWQVVGLIDLLAGWTVIGWIVALALAFALPRPASTPPWPPVLSPDGRWWWDGQAWRPMPPGPPVAGPPTGWS